jgi:hypothetical protein
MKFRPATHYQVDLASSPDQMYLSGLSAGERLALEFREMRVEI